MRIVIALLSVAGVAAAGSDQLKQAEELYNRTDYQASVALLGSSPRDAASWSLIGRDYFMLGEYKKATDAFQHAITLEPLNSVYIHWLGRTYGRRAETSSPLFALGSASKARDCFERAVALDPKNGEALNDLFDYYLEAPGFMGGGYDKATDVARRIAALDPAEGHFAEALLADKKSQTVTAEQHFRRAAELAPYQVGRVLDLAKYLAKQRRYQESDAAFARAEQIAPNSPKVMFAKAKTLIQEKRKLDEARDLLKRYINSTLTPDDPPRDQAEKLLKQVETAG
jgi:cytochrome c-type biogenesis protein CcmH/NrfG